MEGRILLRIKSFKKSRRRIPLEVAAYLVDLVEDDYRIGCSRTVDTIEDTTRKSSYICLSVTANLRLVMDTAKSDTDIFTSESSCH